ncbi:MAG: cellulase family glycosylhydrolase, partial [Pseudomonadota bacterium]
MPSQIASLTRCLLPEIPQAKPRWKYPSPIAGPAIAPRASNPRCAERLGRDRRRGRQRWQRAEQWRECRCVRCCWGKCWQHRKQIGTAFANVGPQPILEGLNEEGRFYLDGDEKKGPDYAALNQLNQLFVTTVRAQGGYNTSRALLIAGFNTDIDQTCVDAFSIPTDPAGTGMLFLSIHYYSPSTFTILDEV